jgi:hypothetical protein
MTQLNTAPPLSLTCFFFRLRLMCCTNIPGILPVKRQIRRLSLQSSRQNAALFMPSPVFRSLPSRLILQVFPILFLPPLLPLTSSPSYKCIGAKLRILLHCFPLNSLPTKLESRLPIGSPLLLIKTQALSSNFTTLPSGREYFFAVRTITACRMSPRRTLLAALTETLPPGPDSGPKLRCFCTTTMMRSPGLRS